DATAFLESFSGSHRYIVDYLTDEVLVRQPSHIRSFLLRTSLLGQLSGPLCDVVTGRTDSIELLAYLEQANLFLIPLDHERLWGRCPGLCPGAPRRGRGGTPPAAEIAHLHERASLWLEREGMLREAVTHALAGGAMDRAARLVAEMVEAYWKHGDIAA